MMVKLALSTCGINHTALCCYTHAHNNNNNNNNNRYR